MLEFILSHLANLSSFISEYEIYEVTPGAQKLKPTTMTKIMSATADIVVTPPIHVLYSEFR